jgi:U32 family peptidase
VKRVTFASSQRDLEECLQAKVLEVLIEPEELSRLGRISLDAAVSLAHMAKEKGMRAVLVWDILACESELRVQSKLIDWVLPGNFSAVRVQDLGAAEWLHEIHPEMPLQLILEDSNHNLEALLGWCGYFGKGLERLILSLQLPEAKLAEYIRRLPVGAEILGAGRVSMFYSRRLLLSPEEPRVWLQSIVSSDDSDNRPFAALQNPHGTFVFLDKDQFILDRLSRLESAGLEAVRVDLRNLDQAQDACMGIGSLSADSACWPRPATVAFFEGNHTTEEFGSLKKHKYVA